MDRGSGLSGLAHAETPAEVTSRYDAWVGNYEADVLRWGYVLPHRIAEMLADALPADEFPSTVLDAGCGTGLVGRAVRDNRVLADRVRLVGVDASAQSVDVAGPLTIGGTPVYAEVHQGDLLQALRFADGRFDGVVCGGVLTYVPDTDAVLREFLRVTRAGGPIIFSQRTDLWAERKCDAVMDALRADQCQIISSDPEPYLPQLEEYGDAIEVIFTLLRGPQPRP